MSHPDLPEGYNDGDFLHGSDINLQNEQINDLDADIVTLDAEADSELAAGLATKQPKFMSGTVGTAQATAAKTVTLDAPWASVTPVAGDILLLKFTLGNNSTSPTLAVNGGSAKSIRTPSGGTDSYNTLVVALNYMVLIYDGTIFEMMGTNAFYAEITAAEMVDPTHTGLRVITGRRLAVLADSALSTVTSATPLALLIGSARTQILTGTVAQTVSLPGSGIPQGWWRRFLNPSSATVAINASGGALVKSVAAGGWTEVTALIAGPTTAAHWFAT